MLFTLYIHIVLVPAGSCIRATVSCGCSNILLTYNLPIYLSANLLQSGQDCFLLACEMGHEEIVRELLTKDKMDRNVVDNVRN